MKLKGTGKRKAFAVVLAASMIIATGCSSLGVSLTAQESDLIAEYASYVVLKHDKTYKAKLQDEVIEETQSAWITPDTVKALSSDSAQGNGNQSGTSQPQETASAKTMSEAILPEGFSLEYTGYTLQNQYTDDIISFTATKGNILMVCNFKITNTQSEVAECNILERKLSFRCRINEEKRVGSQLTMLLNDLYSFEQTLEANETKDAVLIFQIPESYRDNVVSAVLTVKFEEESYDYDLE